MGNVVFSKDQKVLLRGYDPIITKKFIELYTPCQEPENLFDDFCSNNRSNSVKSILRELIEDDDEYFSIRKKKINEIHRYLSKRNLIIRSLCRKDGWRSFTIEMDEDKLYFQFNVSSGFINLSDLVQIDNEYRFIGYEDISTPFIVE